MLPATDGNGASSSSTPATSGARIPLRYAMLGLLALLSVIFYEDVMEMRVAARHMVLGKETSLNKFTTVEEHDRAVAMEREKREEWAETEKETTTTKKKAGGVAVASSGEKVDARRVRVTEASSPMDNLHRGTSNNQSPSEHQSLTLPRLPWW